MSKKPEGRRAYRGEDGEFITKREYEQLPEDKRTAENLPLPGHGTTGRYDRDK